MKIRTLFLAGLAVMAISTAVTAEQTKKKTAVKGWKPDAYTLETERLPVGYTGVDPKKFFQMFKSKLDALKKGKFETPEDFIIRSANADEVLAPINTSDLYAFRIVDNTLKYDGHNQAYSNGNYSCRDTYDRIWVSCKVDMVYSKYDSYRGTNAYGASRTVERSRIHHFALAIERDIPLRSSQFKSKPQSNNYFLIDTFPIPLEKARSLNNGTVATLFVGRVSYSMFVQGDSLITTPTFDWPSERHITEEAVPFDLKKVIYYVVETGEILKQQDF